MKTQGYKSLQQVIAELAQYPAEAFNFLREGLEYTVKRVHGEPSAAWKQLVVWMQRHDTSIAELARRASAGRLPRDIARALRDVGGPEGLESRHVTGEQLCWGLRDLAVERWGFMASAVLRHWNICGTRDFGEMVFALIEADLLQKQRDDRVEDFTDVFDFDDAFDRAYRIPCGARL